MEEAAHAQSGGLRWASSQQTKLFQMHRYKSCCSGRAQQSANADCFFPLLRETKVRAALAESLESLRVQHSALQSSKPQNITKESDKKSVFGSKIFQILGYILETSTLLYLIMVLLPSLPRLPPYFSQNALLVPWLMCCSWWTVRGAWAEPTSNTSAVSSRQQQALFRLGRTKPEWAWSSTAATLAWSSA